MATPDLITEQITTGSLPGAPNVDQAPRPGTPGTIKADPRQEYVAGGTLSSYANYIRALSWSIDDLSVDFGADIYERMLLDPEVSSAVNLLKSSIIEDGLQIASAVDQEDADGFTLAGEIRDTLTAMIEDLSTPMDDVLWNLLDGIALGNKVAEQIYTLQPVNGRQMLALTALKVKPRTSTAFVVDVYWNVIGLLGAVPGQPRVLQSGTILTDPAKTPNLLPRDKFAVYTYRPVDSDPRGTSVCRAAYHAWWLKQQIWPEYLKYLSQFGGPSMIGTTPENAQNVAPTDDLGNPTGAAAVTPEQNLLTALLAFRNGTAMANPHGTEVQLIQSTGEGEAFRSALLAVLNPEITKAILGQTLATGEGQHQARAAAEVHQDAMDTIVRQGKRGLRRMIARDILRPIVLYHWGEKALRLIPKPGFGETEAHDWSTEVESVAKLYATGYIGESQKAALDKRLGLPERDVEFDAQHAAAITQAVPQKVTPVEGEPPVADPAAPTPITANGKQQPKAVAA